MEIKPKNQGTKVLFKNPVLEKLARTNFMVPITMYVVVSAYLMYLNFDRGYLNVLQSVLIFFAGLITWTWVEYELHKHVFHMLTNTKLKERIQYMFHGVHHEYPRDKTRLAMPPLMSAVLVTILYFTFKLFMGKYVFSFLPGFLVGYSSYLFVHYSIHAFRPPKNFLKTLWIYHSVHHYKDDTIAFGVSSPLWDYVYGTVPEKTYKRNQKTAPKTAAS